MFLTCWKYFRKDKRKKVEMEMKRERQGQRGRNKGWKERKRGVMEKGRKKNKGHSISVISSSTVYVQWGYFHQVLVTNFFCCLICFQIVLLTEEISLCEKQKKWTYKETNTPLLLASRPFFPYMKKYSRVYAQTTEAHNSPNNPECELQWITMGWCYLVMFHVLYLSSTA